MEKQAKIIVKNMKYLIRLLHREWERSGKTTVVITIHMEESSRINSRLVGAIQRNAEQLETNMQDFQRSLALSKENFVLLRLVRKVRNAEEKMKRTGTDTEFFLELDKEEYRNFKKIIGTQGE